MGGEVVVAQAFNPIHNKPPRQPNQATSCLLLSLHNIQPDPSVCVCVYFLNSLVSPSTRAPGASRGTPSGVPHSSLLYQLPPAAKLHHLRTHSYLKAFPFILYYCIDGINTYNFYKREVMSLLMQLNVAT